MTTVAAGNNARSDITFLAGGVPVAATGITVSYVSPSGVETVLAPVAGVGVGQFYVEHPIPVDAVGPAFFRWAAADPVTTYVEPFTISGDPILNPPACEAWPVVWTCDKPAGLTAEQEAAALDAAQLLLWSRTGRRLGVCQATESFMPFGPCAIPGDSPGGEIFLTSTPVLSVVAVTVGGQTVPSTRYRLESARLVAVGAPWTPGTPVTVTYRWGVPIEGWLAGLVAMAVGEVAGELASGMCGGACKLPSRAVSVTRSGVTVELGDPDAYVKDGLLGLALADQLITTVNPHKRTSAARVFSPDMARSV